MALTIRTNNVPRPVLDGFQLTELEREEFDYLDWPAIERGEDSASFFRYLGHVYDLGDIPTAPDNFKALGWDGAASDSFFSGILVRWFSPDGSYIGGDEVVIGRWFE
jgi:hypothetical protein